LLFRIEMVPAGSGHQLCPVHDGDGTHRSEGSET
jgi:hypothetical protein